MSNDNDLRRNILSALENSAHATWPLRVQPLRVKNSLTMLA
jgi:hypothetical protein